VTCECLVDFATSFPGPSSSYKDTASSCLLDLDLSNTTEELGLDNDGLLGKKALAQDFVVTSLHNINDGSFVLDLGVVRPRLFTDKRPDLIDVDRRLEELVLLHVEMPHTDFTKVTWMVFVKVDAVMMLSTGVTTATRMLAMFADTSMTMAYMATKLPRLLTMLQHRHVG
jgi:hypothetical protein